MTDTTQLKPDCRAVMDEAEAQIGRGAAEEGLATLAPVYRCMLLEDAPCAEACDAHLVDLTRFLQYDSHQDVA